MRPLWGRATGGLKSEYGISLDVDNLGNVFTTGFYLFDADFDPGIDTAALISTEGWDVFIQKLS